MPTLHDYETWKRQEQERKASEAGIVVESASDSDPDQYAKDLQLGKAFGADASFAGQFRPDLETRLRERKNSTILASSPMLSEWLRNDENSRLARDDLEGLGTIETGVKAAWNATKRGGSQVPMGWNQWLAEGAASQAFDKDKSFWDILQDEIRADISVFDLQGNPAESGWMGPFDLWNTYSRWTRSRGAALAGLDNEKIAAARMQRVGEIQKNIANIPMSPLASSFRNVAFAADAPKDIGAFFGRVAENPMGFMAFLAETAVESAPQLIAATAGTIATKNAAIGATIMGGTSYATERFTSPAEFIAEKKIDISTPEGALKAVTDPKLMREARDRGVIRGLVVGAFDGLSGGIAGKALASSKLGNLALQSIVQATMGGAGELGAQVAAGQEIDWREVIVEALAEFVTAPVEVAGVGGRAVLDLNRRKAGGESSRAAMEQLSQQAQGSKLRARMPSKFREAVEALGHDGNVYIPADKFVEYFQGKGIDIDELSAEMPGIERADIEMALSTGGDVQVPVASYMAHVAGTEHDAFFQQNSRRNPDEMTSIEAQEFNELAREAVDRAYEEAAEIVARDYELKTGEQTVYETMFSRLREAGRSHDVARQEAAPFVAFYRTMAERTGNTVEYLLGRLPLPQIQAELPQGMQFKNVDDVSRMLAELRNRKTKTERQLRGASLLDFLSEIGVKGDRGEIQAILDGSAAGRVGKRSILRQDGLGIDVAAQRAIEAGYLADHPVTQEYQTALEEGREVPDITRPFLEAIDEEMHGRLQFASNPEAEASLQRQRDLDAVEAYLSQSGISLDMPDAEIKTALEQAGQGQSYDQAQKGARSDNPADISAGPDGRTALFDKMQSTWKKHADLIASGGEIKETRVVLKESFVLSALNGQGRGIFLDAKRATAIRHKHPDIPGHVWQSLPELMADPLYAFPYDGKTSVVLDAKTADGSPIVVGMEGNKILTVTPWGEFNGKTPSERILNAINTASSRGEKVYARGMERLLELSRGHPEGQRIKNQTPDQASGVISPTNDPEPRANRNILFRDQVIKKKGRIFYQPNSPRGSVVFPVEGIGRGEAIITLMQSADLSTFLHESGHYFLKMYEALATAPEADARLTEDWAAVKSWWGQNAAEVARDGQSVTGTQVTAQDVSAYLEHGSTGVEAMDTAIDVGMQEQWARGFEIYVMEGKAPSSDLRAAFERFRAWLLEVYRKVRGLGVNVTPEIREVFDRMLATDVEIAEAREMAGNYVMPRDIAESLGISAKDYEALSKLRDEADAEGAARLLQETMAPIRRQREQWYREERSSIKDEVEPRINAMPVYRAIELMGNQRWLGENAPSDLPDLRMSKEALVERYGEGVLKTLPRGKRTIYAVEGGIDPDIAAEMVGFGSGDEMIKAMEAAPRRVGAIEAEIDAIMFERHGDALRDGSTEEKALAAIHGDKRAQLLAAELEKLKSAASDTSPRLTWQQARQSARETIAGMKVRDAMRADRFLAAERRAAKEGQRLSALVARDAAQATTNADGSKALSAGNRMAELVDAKRRQLVNHMLYHEAMKVAEEVEGAQKLAARLGNASTRKRLAGDYLDAIDQVLEQYDFRQLSGNQEARRDALNTYVDRMTAEGRANELAIPADVLSEAQRIPYKTLPVERLRGVVDTLKNIEHTARFKQKLIDAKQQRDHDVVVGDILEGFHANIEANPPARTVSGRANWGEGVQQFGNLVLNADSLLRKVDGFKDGPMYQNIKAPIDAAMSDLIIERRKAGDALENLYSVYSKKERRNMAVPQFVSEIGENLTKWDMLSVALNTGNAENFQRLTDGRVNGSFTTEEVGAITSRLDKRDWDFVQSVWDFIDGYWGQIEARERRVTGVAPKKVEARAISNAHGEYRGGYYPLKYDAQISSRAADDASTDIALSMMSGRLGKAQTKNGHTKERAESAGRPVMIDIGVVQGHVSQVIHDLALSEVVNNSWKILQDSRIRNAYLDAGRKADFDALEVWLQDTAAGQQSSADFLQRAARYAKNGFTVSRLAFNLSTVLLQVTGFTQSMVVVGRRDFLLGVQDMLRGGPLGIAKVGRDIMAKSPFMAERETTFNKDIQDIKGDMKDGAVSGRWSQFMNDIMMPLSFYLMQKTQFYTVDMPTWLAGYRQALKQGKDEAGAIAHADRIVARSQASGLYSDRTAIERGSISRTTRQNDVVRLFTTLGSYMFAKANVAYERTQTTDFKSPMQIMSWAFDMALLFSVEAVLMGALKGKLPDDEDDEGWLEFLAKETALTAAGTIPFIRDMASGFQGFDTGGAYGSIGKLLVGAVTNTASAWNEGEVDRKTFKSWVDAGGFFLNLPSVQINRAVDAWWRGTEGEEVPLMDWAVGKTGKKR